MKAVPHYDAVIDSSIGRIGIVCDGEALAAVHLDVAAEPSPPRTPFARRVVMQMREYFAGRRGDFDLPLVPATTVFRQRAREEMCRIAAGKTKSYGEIAAVLHSAPRAVGGACRSNPLLIVVPCHRVVAVQGLGGYGGATTAGDRLEIKRWLLRHEGAL